MGEDEDKVKEMKKGEMKEEKEKKAQESIPTNREMYARVFSYVRCVVASRRFRVLSCKASRRDTTRCVTSPIIWNEGDLFANWTIERLIKLFFSSLLPRPSLRFRCSKEDCENEEPRRDVNYINDLLILVEELRIIKRVYQWMFLLIRRESYWFFSCIYFTSITWCKVHCALIKKNTKKQLFT